MSALKVAHSKERGWDVFLVRIRSLPEILADIFWVVFGHNSPSSQIRYNEISLFPSNLGTAGGFLRIVPLGLSTFGHRCGFFKNRSKFRRKTRGTIE